MVTKMQMQLERSLSELQYSLSETPTETLSFEASCSESNMGFLSILIFLNTEIIIEENTPQLVLFS